MTVSMAPTVRGLLGSCPIHTIGHKIPPPGSCISSPRRAPWAGGAAPRAPRGQQDLGWDPDCPIARIIATISHSSIPRDAIGKTVGLVMIYRGGDVGAALATLGLALSLGLCQALASARPWLMPGRGSFCHHRVGLRLPCAMFGMLLLHHPTFDTRTSSLGKESLQNESALLGTTRARGC